MLDLIWIVLMTALGVSIVLLARQYGGRAFSGRWQALVLGYGVMLIAMSIFGPEWWASLFGAPEPTIVIRDPCETCIWFLCWGC